LYITLYDFSLLLFCISSLSFSICIFLSLLPLNSVFYNDKTSYFIDPRNRKFGHFLQLGGFPFFIGTLLKLKKKSSLLISLNLIESIMD